MGVCVWPRVCQSACVCVCVRLRVWGVPVRVRPHGWHAWSEVTNELLTLLDLCVSSLRRGHANLFCIVPILTGDPRRGSGAQSPDYDSEMHRTTTASCKVHLARVELATLSV